MNLFTGTALSLMLSAALSLVGCASKPLDPSSYFEILASSVPDSPVTSDHFLLGDTDSRPYLVIEANGQPREINQSQEATERFKSTWKTVDGDDREQFFRQDAAGNILLTAVIEPGENAISLFNPPLIAAYRKLEPSESRSQDIAMIVVSASNPTRQRESGTARQTITYLDDCQVRLPWGTFVARRLSVVFEADLKLAEVHVETMLYVVAEYGVLIEETKKTIQILGIIPRHDSILRVLIGPEEADLPL